MTIVEKKKKMANEIKYTVAIEDQSVGLPLWTTSPYARAK